MSSRACPASGISSPSLLRSGGLRRNSNSPAVSRLGSSWVPRGLMFCAAATSAAASSVGSLRHRESQTTPQRAGHIDRVASPITSISTHSEIFFEHTYCLSA